MRLALRIAARFLLAIAAIAFLLASAGEIRQRILVHRAGRLLSDIHGLRLRQSNWEDAQKLMARWGRWGHWEGQCTRQDCMYVVTLQNGTIPEGNLAEWPSRMLMLADSLRLLPRQWAGGLRELQGMFLVQDGLVRRTGLSIDMTVSPFAKGAQGACCGDELIISTVSHGALRGQWSDESLLARHSDYKIWRPGGCTFCLMGRLTYSSSVSADQAARWSDFQLSCATHWSSCITLEQLDPAAREWRLYGPPWGEAPEYEAPVPEAGPNCQIPVYARARDAATVFVIEPVETVETRTELPDSPPPLAVKAKVIAVLKGNPPFLTGTLPTVISTGRNLGGDDFGRPLPLEKGKQYFVFFDQESQSAAITSGPCGFQMRNPAATLAVSQGIAMDDGIRGPEPVATLQGFTRSWNRDYL